MFSLIGIALGATALLPHGDNSMLGTSTGNSERISLAEPEGGANSPGASLELIGKGRELYQRRCGACHSPDANRVGPKHRGVYGQKAGSVEGFRYSKALREIDVVWNDETLDAWLENPPAFAPGTSMGFRLPDAGEREAIIAYLKSLSAASTAGDTE